VIGEAGVGKWQAPEYYEALDRWAKAEPPFPLMVVLLDGQTAPGLPFLRQFPKFTMTAVLSCGRNILRIVGRAMPWSRKSLSVTVGMIASIKLA
jgi:hypothetical protein